MYTNSYLFFYDETQHDRRITEKTFNSDNYFDEFITVTVGWKSLDNAIIKNEYEKFSEKYSWRRTKDGEIKSQSIHSKSLKYGFASLNKKETEFIFDLLNLYDDKVNLFILDYSKLEFIVNQMLETQRSRNPWIADSMLDLIVRTITLYRPKEVIDSIFNNPENFIPSFMKFMEQRTKINEENLKLKNIENLSFALGKIFLKDIDMNYGIDWDYGLSFLPILEFIEEKEVDDYLFYIDKEGTGKTLAAALNEGLTNSYEIDSRDSFGICLADLFAGLLMKLIRSMDEYLRYKDIADTLNKKMLGKEWFQINESQFNLYKKMYKLMFDDNLNSSIYLGKFATNMGRLVGLLKLFNGCPTFKIYDELKNKYEEIMPELLNSLMLYELMDMTKTKIMNSNPSLMENYFNEDYYFGNLGQQIYRDPYKQPVLALKEGKQEFILLSLGIITSIDEPIFTVIDPPLPKCYRVPKEFLSWTKEEIILLNKNKATLPAQIMITKNKNKYNIKIIKEFTDLGFY